MRILSLNCGSSSIKGALIDTMTGRCLLEVHIEELGRAACRLRSGDTLRALGGETTLERALQIMGQELREQAANVGAVAGVAHRVVHGGDVFREPAIIDDAVLATLTELASLAPLHNPPAVAAIRIARQALSGIPHVAVFDTAFHATLPAHAREYALPRDLVYRYALRRYGFHGTNHRHVMLTTAAHLQLDPESLRIISCHLGNGASLAAIEGGRSVDTSMGMTPLEGLIMGTRAGDLDPGILLLLQRHLDVDALETILNQHSGLRGLTGTNDMREVAQLASQGNRSCRLALEMYVHRVKKYIGAYAAILAGVDVIAFTGGIGENSALIRRRCLQDLEFLGVIMDEDVNRSPSFDATLQVADISAPTSRVRLLVVHAAEELAMAREAAARIEAAASQQ